MSRPGLPESDLRGGQRPLARAALIGAGALVATVLVVPTATGSTPASPTATATPTSSPSTAPLHPAPPSNATGFRVVETNLDSPQPVSAFQQDMHGVLNQHPDFAILNEVAYRADGVMAPPGYSIWRTPGKYTGETAVVWNSTEWTETASGTAMISDKPGIPPGKRVELGMRYANWVTLTNGAGRLVSVVSTHYVPPVKGWPNLAPVETQRLGRLVDMLSQRGPVIAGGDLNAGYHSPQFPRRAMAAHHLVPTYQSLGTPPGGTGDHYGYTIDYTLMRQNGDVISPHNQYTLAQNSDHKAVTTDFHWDQPPWGSGGATAPAFTAGTVRNRPSGTTAARSRAIDAIVRGLQAAGAGSGVHLITSQLTNGAVGDALIAAYHRGVHVQVVVRNGRMTAVERKVRQVLGNDTAGRGWFRRCGTPSCVSGQRMMPPTALLVSQAGRTPSLKMRSDRPLDRSALVRPTTVVTTTGLVTYRTALAHFAALRP